MKIIISFFVLLNVVLFSSCNSDKNSPKEIIYQNNYFPLQVGNVWEYPFGDKTKIISVKSIVDRDNHKYFLIEEINIKDSVVIFRCERLYRCNKEKNIEVVDYGYNKWYARYHPQVVWYKFNAKIGESVASWDSCGNISVNGNKTRVTSIKLISTTDTVVTKDTAYTNCYKFLIDQVSSSDEEYYEWFAKDIGLVKRESEYKPGSPILLSSLRKAPLPVKQ